MHNNFSKALEWVIHDEGGRGLHYSDQPTHSGVTLIALQAVRPNATLDDLNAMSNDAVDEVYADIWVRCGARGLPSGIDYLMFDCAVNPGPSWAAYTLQRTVGAKQDGIIGPRTLGRARAEADRDFGASILAGLTNSRVHRYAKRAVDIYQLGLQRRAAKAYTRAADLALRGICSDLES